MFEKGSLRQSSEGEQIFINNPASVISEHLSRVGDPDTGSIEAAAKIIRTSYPLRDALGISLDLNSNISNPTTALAEMFATDHNALPSHWKENPEITRTVLSMSGQIEAGILKALQISEAHMGGDPRLDSRLLEIEQLVDALQQK